MDIVILANFTGDFSATDNNRFLYLAKMLSDENDVEIVTSNFYHATKSFRNNIVVDNLKTTLLAEPGYKKNISLKRFYSHCVWGNNVIKYLMNRKKPDVVFAAVPSLTAPLLVAKYCKENSIRFIIDVNDLWPEAFKMAFDIPLLSDLVFMPFKIMANGIYKRADYIFGVSETYVNRALQVNHMCEGSTAIYIGTDLNTFDENVRNNPVRKPDTELWLGYCGSLSMSYDLITVMDALALIKERGIIPPKLVVMGDGARKQEFEQYAMQKYLDVVFTGRLPYDKMCGMLSVCDIVVNPIAKKSAASIINKHADYTACGRSVINMQDSAEYRNLVQKYKMGINCDSTADMERALIYLTSNKRICDTMGGNARKCFEEVFDRRKTYKRIAMIICRS